MSYDNTNNGVGFSCSAFSGKINIAGTDYKLAFAGASDKAKYKFDVFIWNKEECYQTVIFDKDKKNDKSPNYGGQIKLNNGAEYWLSVWHKKSDKGNYFLSVSVKDKDDKPVIDSKSSYSDIDSEIPF